MPEISQRTFAICVAVLLLLHLAIAAPLAWHLNIWMDEASTLYATQNGFWVAFQTATAEQKQAPLYFWILSVWRLADDSIFFARLFSICCSLGAIAIFASLARRFFSNLGALAVTAFFALHPYLIWASLEIRVYSMVVLLTVILFSLFMDAFFDDEHPRSYKQWWFLAAVIVSLYTNYYLGFVIAALFFALVLTGRIRPAFRYAGLMLLALAAFLPLGLSAVSEFGARSDDAIKDWTLIECGKTVWYHFLTFLFPTEILPPADQTPVSFARLWIARLVLAGVAVLTFLNRRNLTRQTAAFWIITLAVAAFLALAGLLVGPMLIANRHASVMFAATILGFALLIRDISVEWPSKISTIASAGGLLFVIALFSYSITHLYPQHVKRGDWSNVAKFIEQNESADQPIVVFQTYESLAPRFHYVGANKILPNSRFFDFIPGGGERSAENVTKEIDFVISEIPKEAGKIWLVTTDFCFKSDRCGRLTDYIESNYTTEVEKDFHLAKLYLLKKRLASE